MKDINKHIPTTSSLNKEEMSHHKLAVDYAKITIARKRFAVTAITAIIAAASLGIGLYFSFKAQNNLVQQKIDQDAQLIKQQDLELQTQLILRFIDLRKSSEQYDFVKLLDNINGLDKKFIDKLLTAALDSEKTIPMITSYLSDEDRKIINSIQTTIENLPKKRELRVTARTELANHLSMCPASLCLPYLDQVFQVSDLRTSERYRIALGIAVAIGGIEGSMSVTESNFSQLFADAPETIAIRSKLEKLTTANDPTIKARAATALAKFNN